ncbi:MAG: sensor histidine kinase [Pseudomonadota bacterium]
MITNRPSLRWIGAFFFALLAFAAALLTHQPLTAQTSAEDANDAGTIILPIGNNHAQTFGSIRYLITETQALDADAVLAQRDAFKPVASPWIDFGDQDGAVWLLTTVRNDQVRSGEWMIDVQRPFVDELLVQKVTESGARETLLAVDGDTHFDDRPVVSQYLVAPLFMEAGETAQILVGMRSSTGSWMPLTFATPERMRTAHMQEARFNWIINGAIGALALVALAMGRLVGWRLALGFAAYALAGALFVANNEGYLHRFVLPDVAWLYQPLNFVLLPVMALAALHFAKLFAELKERRPRLALGVTMLQILLAVLAIIAALFWRSSIPQAMVLGAVPIAALVYVLVGVGAWRDRVLGALPFLLGTLALALTIAVMAAVLLAPGRFAMTVALDYFHITLLFEALAFFIAILVRMLAMQRDLNRSLQAEVAATNEKLALAEQLQQSRSRYDAARDKAESMRARLASTTHDLQQPMISLRQGLQRLASRDDEASGKLAAALDYLEAVTATGLADSTPEDDQQAGEKPDEGAESFAASVVLDNCAAMFRSEAEARGAELRIRPSKAKVHTDPVALMRAVSNLVSNALKHASPSKVLIAAQERETHVLVRVIDNGKGMDEAQLAQLTQAYAKGDDSDGQGLGLALVQEFAQSPGHDLNIQSKPGMGTCFALRVPLAH